MHTQQPVRLFTARLFKLFVVKEYDVWRKMFFALGPTHSVHKYDTIPAPLRILQKYRILCRPSSSVPVLIDKVEQHACHHAILVTIFTEHHIGDLDLKNYKTERRRQQKNCVQFS
jgi:hypothetical protein